MTPSASGQRRLLQWLPVAAVVLLSTVVHAWLARSYTAPWIAPDEMLYALTGQSLWETGELTVRGLETPYYSFLYPALIGLPLQAARLADGVERAQLVQALAMSLAAVPVYAMGRRFLSQPGAVAAAALAVALPALAYTGFLMTESLYYPLVALALYALVRTLEEPTAWRQGVFMAAVLLAASVRLQALVLIPALALAALVYGRMTRSWATPRRLLPLFAGFAAGAAVLAVLAAAGRGLSWEDALGAYGTLGEDTVLDAGVLEEIVWHVTGLAVVAAGVPLLVTALLAVVALRDGEPDSRAASFLASATAYALLLLVQVGFFAAGHLEHVSERYLLTAAPPLLLGLVLWVERGAPRPRLLLLALGGLLVLALAVTPADRIAGQSGLQDALSSAVLTDLAAATSDGWMRVVLVLAGAACVAAVALTPRRLLYAVVALVAVVLVVQTGFASRDVDRASAAEQRKALGEDPPTWIDALDAGPVTLLATGDRPWTADARTFFWNRAIRDAVALDGSRVAIPPTSVPATMREADGTVVDAAGTPLGADVVVAPSTVVLDGTKLGEAQAPGAEVVGMSLWRVDGGIRILQRRAGFLPNGDLVGEASIMVPGCRPGSLELTLLGKSGAPIDVTANGFPVRTVTPAAGTVLTESIPSPPDVDGTRPCVFGLRTTNLVGTSRVEYVPS